MTPAATSETIILCAGPINYTNLPIGTNLSNAMIPVNGKPVIAWILDDLLTKSIIRVTVILRDEDRRLREFLERAYGSRMDLCLVALERSGSIVESVRAGLLARRSEGLVRVVLGDTLIRDSYQGEESFVYIGPVSDSRRWCVANVDEGGRVVDYVDKQRGSEGPHQALAGYYHFTRGDLLRAAVDETVHEGGRELSDVLRRYGAEEPIRARSVVEWYDFGHIDNLVDARRRLLRPRHFNRLTINPVLNTIKKVSEHDDKLQDELEWYLSIPSELQALTPRILGHSRENGRLEIVQEYYGYPTLAELFVFGDMPVDTWMSILRHVLRIHEELAGHRGPVSAADAEAVYLGKTRERVARLQAQDERWEHVLNLDELHFNGQKLVNLNALEAPLVDQVEKLIQHVRPGIIHGDLCFSNILFDVNNKIIRLIDPRGRFGRRGIYGDVRYDLAKLRHSIHGLYDFIVADMFVLEGVGADFRGEIFAGEVPWELGSRFDQMVEAAGYELEEIRLIEGLLFVSMLPMHQGHPERQTMMLLTGLRLLNEVLA